MLGSLLKPWSAPFCQSLVRYVFGSAIPKSVRAPTVRRNSRPNKAYMSFGSRQCRVMKNRGMLDVLKCDAGQRAIYRGPATANASVAIVQMLTPACYS